MLVKQKDCRNKEYNGRQTLIQAEEKMNRRREGRAKLLRLQGKEVRLFQQAWIHCGHCWLVISTRAGISSQKRIDIITIFFLAVSIFSNDISANFKYLSS